MTVLAGPGPRQRGLGGHGRRGRAGGDGGASTTAPTTRAVLRAPHGHFWEQL